MCLWLRNRRHRSGTGANNQLDHPYEEKQHEDRNHAGSDQHDCKCLKHIIKQLPECFRRLVDGICDVLCQLPAALGDGVEPAANRFGKLRRLFGL